MIVTRRGNEHPFDDVAVGAPHGLRPFELLHVLRVRREAHPTFDLIGAVGPQRFLPCSHPLRPVVRMDQVYEVSRKRLALQKSRERVPAVVAIEQLAIRPDHPDQLRDDVRQVVKALRTLRDLQRPRAAQRGGGRQGRCRFDSTPGGMPFHHCHCSPRPVRFHPEVRAMLGALRWRGLEPGQFQKCPQVAC